MIHVDYGLNYKYAEQTFGLVDILRLNANETMAITFNDTNESWCQVS